MEVDVSQPIVGYDGKVVMQQIDGRPDEPVTVRGVMTHALNTLAEGERLALGESARFHALSTRLWSAPRVRLDLEERTLILDRVVKNFNPLVVGFIKNLFEQPDAERGPTGPGPTGPS